MTQETDLLRLELSTVWQANSAMNEKLKAQEAELKRTQAAMSTNQVTMDGLVFESSLRVASFVSTNRMSAMPVCCVDLVSFLQLASHEVVSHNQAVTEEAAAIKAGYDSHIQSVISTSFQMILPSFFGGASASITAKSGTTSVEMKNIKPLPAFASFEEFDDHSTLSARATLEGRIPNAEGSLLSSINQSEMSDRAKAFVSRCVSASSLFLICLLTFMERFFQELTVSYHTTPAEAWHMVASIVKQIFVDMALVRSCAKFIHISSSDSERVASALMWSTL